MAKQYSEIRERGMQPATLIRAGSWTAIAAGVLLAADLAAHVVFSVDDTFRSARLWGMPHELWHIPGIAGVILALFGLMTIYARQAREAGWLGLVGFVLLIIGMVVGAAYSVIFHAIFLPALEQAAPTLLEGFLKSATPAEVVRGVVVQAVGLGLGALLFGLATVRARVLPPTGGWLFVAGALLAAANQVTPAAQLVSRLVFALGFVILGYGTRPKP
ncbi:MAG TPA: hypothetical protein VJ793_03540 [Anaerolineae bacterium]|nr:hypothetical protein [Anaerolineae bacterium]